MADLYTITVSGKSYEAALNPLATGAHDEGLVSTGIRNKGRGRQYLYELDGVHLEAMIKRLTSVGVSYLDNDSADPETRNEGRACLRDAAKLKKLMA